MEVMINSEVLKSLRLKKSWSQEKLANATGLSLRTVQRVENTGTASLETKLALSSALEIKPEKLCIHSSKTQERSNPVIYGYLGAAIGLVGSYAGISLGLWQGNLSFGQAGLWYGLVGAFVGLTCGAIGFLNTRG
ncbi:helix-turn-helix transcriptional regulator [Enterovibrio norvegicus]|uniref:helix-turn-helix domain-containing protein n=1 Tax=Enterovibrio norvegicus TaxID=188144 RepID=UPI000C859B93|nr:helix-turn-helix domain-containing protein [Enterovibrio norvegicus]PMI35087.1 transcriptional regulator [Enterovibrio norvegicus]TKF06650.1 helix-turn-helix transcriptional regulator [Enterovibrio norvegicus]